MKSYQTLPMLASLAMAVPQSLVVSAGSYTLAGCYTQGLLSNQNTPSLGVLNTVEICAMACAGTQFMAVSGGSCTCGSGYDPSNPPTLTGAINCNVVCPGNSTEICGGATYINVYRFKAVISTPSSSVIGSIGPISARLGLPLVNTTTAITLPSSAAPLIPSISVSATITVGDLLSIDLGLSLSASLGIDPSTSVDSTTPTDSMSATVTSPTGSTNSATVSPTIYPNTTVLVPTTSSKTTVLVPTSSSNTTVLVPTSSSNTTVLVPTSSSYATTTTFASPATSPNATTTSGFQLQIIMNGTMTVSKRQVAPASQYLLADGQVTNNLALAATFFVLGGQLYSTALYATDVGIAYEAFAAGTGGAITTTFTATGALAWNNLVFGNTGAASFCQLGSGLVNVVFTGPNPAGCTPIVLKVIPLTPSSTGVSPFAPTITSGTTVINNYVINNNNVVNTNTLNENIQNNFNSNTINYFNVTTNIFLAKFCPSCPVIQAQRDCGCYFQGGVPVAIPDSFVPVCPVCPAGASVRVGTVTPSTTTTIYTTTCVTVGSSTLTSSSPISTVVLAITQAPVSSVLTTSNGVLSTVLVPAAVAAASVPVSAVTFSSLATAAPALLAGTPAPLAGTPAPSAVSPASSVGTAPPASVSTPAAFIGAASTIESTGLLAIFALAGLVLF